MSWFTFRSSFKWVFNCKEQYHMQNLPIWIRITRVTKSIIGSASWNRLCVWDYYLQGILTFTCQIKGEISYGLEFSNPRLCRPLSKNEALLAILSNILYGWDMVLYSRMYTWYCSYSLVLKLWNFNRFSDYHGRGNWPKNDGAKFLCHTAHHTSIDWTNSLKNLKSTSYYILGTVRISFNEPGSVLALDIIHNNLFHTWKTV